MSANGSSDDEPDEHYSPVQYSVSSPVIDLNEISPALFGAQDPASLEEEAFSLALNHKHKALADERVRQNSVGPWSDDPGSPGHLKRAAGHAATPKRGQAAKRHPSAVKQRPASAQRPSPTTTVSAGRPASATIRRPTSATIRPTPLQPPGSAKRGAPAPDEEESELLSSANIAAARYYAGLGESSARKRLVTDTGVARDVYKANDTDAVPHPHLASWHQRESASSVPIFTPPRLHLRNQLNAHECVMETPTGYCALRIPGFSQRLTQTERVPRKSLLQKVLERGGGSALSFDRDNATDRVSKAHPRTGKHTSAHLDNGHDNAGVVRMGQERQARRHGVRNVGSSASKSPITSSRATGSRSLRRPASAQAKEQVAGDSSMKGSGVAAGEWIPPTPRYPYYKDRNKGKEKDGEQVGLRVMSLRVHGTKEPHADEAVRESTEICSSSAGFARRRPRSEKAVCIQRRPLSARVGNEISWLQDDSPSPPVEPRKRGAITIAELDRQLRLLEMQAKAEERGGPRLKRAGQTEHDSHDAYGTSNMARGAASGRRKRLQHPPPHHGSHQLSSPATPRGFVRGGLGGDTPRSVGIQGSKVSLLSSRGLSGGGNLDDEVPPFEIWSFQGKHQSFRRPHPPDLSTLGGGSGKENEILEARDSPRIKSLTEAPAHNVLKGTGIPSFVNTRFADQSIFLRGKAVFAPEQDLGHFLSAKDLASFRVKEEGPDRALEAAVKAGDELGQSLKERMVVPSLLQQMEQHSRDLCDFLRGVLESEGPDQAELFCKVWEGSNEELSLDASGDVITNVSRQARQNICNDVWSALTERNMYIAPGTLNSFIPDLIPENMEYDEQHAVVSLLRLVVDRSVHSWWDNDPVAQQFCNLYLDTAHTHGPYGHDLELEFQINCQMKENLMVRVLVIPSYLIAVMTSSLWRLPAISVNRDEENRFWLKTCLLLRMHFVKCDLDNATNTCPTIQDAYWSVNEETRKMDFSMFSSGVLREVDEEIREDEGDVLDSGKIMETRDRARDEEEEKDMEGDSLVTAGATTGESHHIQERGGGEAAGDSHHIQERGGAEGMVGQEDCLAHVDGSEKLEESGLDLSITLLASEPGAPDLNAY